MAMYDIIKEHIILGLPFNCFTHWIQDELLTTLYKQTEVNVAILVLG